MPKCLVARQLTNERVNVISVDDGTHYVDLIEFVRLQRHEFTKASCETKPHIVVGHCEAADGRISEDSENESSCYTIVDLIVEEFYLDEVKHVRDDHYDGFHLHLVQIDVLEANLVALWIIVVIELR